ncbi:hypothetical protein YB2330_001586 [Saitoella coloradoensis]
MAPQGDAIPADSAPAPAIPDYMTDPNAVLKDQNITWRNKRAPDYTKVNAEFEKTKTTNHEAGSLQWLVQNLVKNWEKEASYKTVASEWRTIDHEKYTFHVNGGPGMTAEDMLRLGTYNALLGEKQVEGVYDPKMEGFQGSHKLFKRVMPVFSWEVLEVYSGPPVVAFKWRHWGQMTGKYSTKLQNPPRKVTAEAHGGPIDIEGITVATVSADFKIEKLETFYDPAAIFEQLALRNDMKTEYLNEDGTPMTAEESVTSGMEKMKLVNEAMGRCPFRPGAAADLAKK